MATLVIQVPDDKVQLIGEAFANYFAMPTPLDKQDPPKPLTGQQLSKAQVEFARQKLIEHVNRIVHEHLVSQQPVIPIVPPTPVNLG